MKANLTSIKRTIALFLTGAMLALPGCSKKTDSNSEGSGAQSNTQSETKGDYLVETIKLAGGQDWGGPNPYKRTQRGPASQKVNLVFDSLLQSGVNGRIPLLAKEYKQDGNKFTFILNENALWHDGQKVTANDVAFTIDYYKKNPPVSGTLGEGDKFVVESTNVVDDTTIEINVKQVGPDTLSNISTFYIIPKHIWEKVDDPKTYNGEDQFIGCGAFKLKSYEAASGSYEYEAMENYYYGKQVSQRVLFVPVSDPILAFNNGEIDLTDVSVDLLEQYKQRKNIGIIETANSFGYRMHINMDKQPIFKDVEMRKALYYAIDRQSILTNVLRGGGAVGSAGYCPSTSTWYSPDVEQYEYNPEKAKAAFEGKNISINLVTESQSAANVKIAEIVKMNLESAGIKVSVTALDTQGRDRAAGTGDYDLIIISNGGWGLEPSQLPGILTVGEKGTGPGAGVRGWSSEKINGIVDNLKQESDEAKRKEIYKELQIETSQEVPFLILATSSSYNVFNKDYYSGWKLPYDSQQFMHSRINFVQGDFK